MKILVLTNNFGGLHSFRKEVVQAMVDKGYAVSISAPVDFKTHFFEEMGCEIINTEHAWKGMNPLTDLGLVFRYRKILKRIKPDVVLSYTIKPNLYGGMACQMCHIPQIANITGLGSALENPGILQTITKLLYKIGLHKTKTVFFQNKANKDFCENNGLVRGNRILIPGSGVNLKHHTFQPYPTSEEPLKFIFISRLVREKGIDEYMSAAKRIKESHPHVEFHILGRSEGQYEERVKKMQDAGIVKYHGVVSDVRPFVRECHCTVHPSFYPEGISNVLLESCAAGRPIITTNRPGCGEIVEDGKTGFLVRAKDVDNLVETIERFIDLPYDQKIQMGVAARKKVEKEFDREIVVEAYLKEIQSLN